MCMSVLSGLSRLTDWLEMPINDRAGYRKALHTAVEPFERCRFRFFPTFSTFFIVTVVQ
jgi:hypothetical protein